MEAFIWLSAANVLLVIVSMISSWRIQTSKNHAEDRILPNYKIKWYLDREYLRFKKTAKEIRIFNQDPMMISAVFQDYNLFALPIKENVGVSCEPNVCKVVNAMRSAGVSERLISERDAYLYRQLDPDGIEVSGGEGQKIAIARAFYKDTDIIIMDEPTSSLDPISEATVYERIHSEYKDKTVIFISHRLSSCKFCDRVLVMEGGSIIQEGTHDKLLLHSKGRYCELWNAQAQYYQT